MSMDKQNPKQYTVLPLIGELKQGLCSKYCLHQTKKEIKRRRKK